MPSIQRETELVTKRKGNGHVLLMRLSAMGDVAMTVPVVAALRSAYPDIRITILTRTAFRPFFRDIVGIDFAEFEPAGRHKGFMGLVRLADELCRLGIDSVADLHDVLRTKVLRALFRLHGITRISVIDKGRAEKRELTRRTGKRLVPLAPMTERYKYTIRALGFDFDMPREPQRAVCPIPRVVIDKAGAKEGKWVGMAPFAKHMGKIYPIPLADQLIRLLSERYQRVFIFGGGPNEQSFAEGMEQRHPGVFSVIGRMPMTEEMDLIANLDAMVTMDSATMHIASLLGVPVVSVWGATHPYAGFYGYGQNPANAVQADLACRPCSVFGDKPCIFGDYRCMNSIEPQEIADRVDSVTAAAGNRN